MSTAGAFAVQGAVLAATALILNIGAEGANYTNAKWLIRISTLLFALAVISELLAAWTAVGQ